MRTLAAIACYNEEIAIGSVVLKARHHVDEVLVIDDGSRDDTAKIAKEAGATVISHISNKGKSAAMKTGFEYGIDKDFEYMVTIDGDGQHNPDEIPNILKDIQNNSHDMSIGFRVNTEMPRWRRIGKRALDYGTRFAGADLTEIIKTLVKHSFIEDSQSGFRAFNRRAMDVFYHNLNGKGFSIESEELFLAHDLDLKIANTRVSCKYRNIDTSNKRFSVSHGFSVLRYILRRFSV